MSRPASTTVSNGLQAALDDVLNLLRPPSTTFLTVLQATGGALPLRRTVLARRWLWPNLLSQSGFAHRRRTRPEIRSGGQSAARQTVAAAGGAGKARHPFVHERPARRTSTRSIPSRALAKYAGQESADGQSDRPSGKTGAAFPSPFKFNKYGQSGHRSQRAVSRTSAELIDDICVIRSMHADVPNHEPSLLLMNCGEARLVRPSLGSWLTYGLGTENQNLPGFIAMCPGGYPIQESQNWQAAFLPGVYQGTYIDTQHRDRKADREHPQSTYTLAGRAAPAAGSACRAQSQTMPSSGRTTPQLEARIQSFELAYRMQTEWPSAFDVEREPQYIRDMYGPGAQARQILIARRLIERGVRFVQVWHGAGQPWDSHDDLEVQHRNLASNATRPIGALWKDLKQRGHAGRHAGHLGRRIRPHADRRAAQEGQNAGEVNGRDHNHYGFTIWLAGGGVKGGDVHGATDEFGFKAVEQPVHVHDLHATMLRLLGFDHEKLPTATPAAISA